MHIDKRQQSSIPIISHRLVIWGFEWSVTIKLTLTNGCYNLIALHCLHLQLHIANLNILPDRSKREIRSVGAHSPGLAIDIIFGCYGVEIILCTHHRLKIEGGSIEKFSRKGVPVGVSTLIAWAYGDVVLLKSLTVKSFVRVGGRASRQNGRYDK
jgi:hypothetical protein